MSNLFALILGSAFPLLLVVALVFGIDRSNFDTRKKLNYKLKAGILLIWATFVWIISYEGLFNYVDGDIAPRFLMALIIPVSIGLLMFKSSNFIKVLDNIPHSAIVGIQGLRILGISFLFVATHGLGPAEFASAGYGDLVTGTLAIIGSLLLLTRSQYARPAVWLFNIAGMFDLLNVSRILLKFYPSWYDMEPSTAIAGEFPTVLILGIAAPIALMLHVYSIRSLVTTMK